MIYYFEFNEKYQKYIRKELGNEEIENNKCFTIDGSGDSFKVIVYCNVELALKPNTIVLSEDEELNKYWWVVQEDKSTLIDTNLYKHELQLVGAIEWFKFKFCYTGTFYYHRYSYFEVMQKLLYSLWKPKFFEFNLGNFTSEFGSAKNNQKFTFKGYTIRSALEEIEKALNVDFKLKFVTSKLSIEETVSGTTGSQSLNNGTQASINEKDYKNDFQVYDYQDHNRFEIYAKSNIISKIIETISNENSEKEIEIIFYTIIGSSPLIPELVNLKISMSFSASVVDGKLTLKNKTYPNGTVTLSSVDSTVETTFFVPKEIVFSMSAGGGDYYSQIIETEGPDQNYMSELGFDKFYIKEIISDDKDNIYISEGYFDFIHKNPSTNISFPINSLDEKYQISQFPNKSYASRVVGRVSNATSGATCTYPKVGYAKLNANNDLTLNKGNACIILPYNIDRIDNLQFKLIYSDTTSGIETGDYVSLYETYENKDKPLEVKIGASITKIRLKEKTLYDFITDTNERDHTLWYERGKNIIHNFEPYLSGYHVYPLSKNENVDTPNIAIDFGFNKNVVKVIFSSILEETLITSNTQVNCDDVIYNQTGSNADLVLTKDFVNSYATSISTGTLTRIKYHNKESECFKVGSVFIKDNERYVVSSVSIDKYKDKVKAEYKLSKDYVAKTELISADGSIESYAIPQNNIVKRIQEYKTLIRFRDTPSLKQESYTEARYFTDFTSSERNDFVLEIKGTSKNGNTYFVGLNPITIETAKTSILMYDMRDNNYAGFVVNETGNAVKSYYQYALNYVDSDGELKSIEMKLKYAGKFNILPYMSNYPYLTKEDFESNRFLSSITNENNYLKDGYETPVFLFTREYQDHYGFVFGDNVSLENGGSLKLYLSANLINNNLFSTNNLEFINDLQISSLQTHDNGYKYFEISFTRKDENDIPSFSALGKNLVVFNRNGMVFAKNNCKQFETNYDEKNLTRTYIWRIYLETYKI